MTVVLTVVLIAQTPGRPVGWALALSMVGLQVLRSLRTGPSTAPPAMPRGRFWPDGCWVLTLVGLWLALLVVAGTPGIWLAFPLMLVQMQVLGPHRGSAAVAVTAVAAVVAGLASGLQSTGAVLGPLLGGAVVIAVVIGLETVLRESQFRKDLIDELVVTQRELARVERERGAAAERERLAREVHDTVAQGLTSIDLLLRVAEESGDYSRVVDARQVARDNLAEVRRFVRGLAPADLAGSSVDRALERVVRRVQGVRTHWVTVGAIRSVDVVPAAALVRACQSGTANVVQHAHADSMTVTLTFTPDTVRLDMADDGVGFDATQAGFGLHAMRVRVEEIGGAMHVESGAQGTRVAIEVPA